MGLVIWMALFVKNLSDVFCYVNDTFGWESESNFIHYAQYSKEMPAKQVRLLSCGISSASHTRKRNNSTACPYPSSGFRST